MRILYRFFLLLAVSSLTVLSGCREDENLNLLTYPDNSFTLAAEGEEGSEITVNAFYNNDGILEFDKPATFTFRFNASPEETIVTFEPIGENVELSDTKLIIPAGYTDASVTLDIKDMEAFQANYEEAVCNLGVKATVEGYRMPSTTLEAKALVKKEAYVAAGFLEGKADSKTEFVHTVFAGNFLETEENKYIFNVRLERPARKDVKVTFNTVVTGVNEEALDNVIITPSEIVIPAGQKISQDITWEIGKDFLLGTDRDVDATFTVTADFECGDPVVSTDETRNSFSLKVVKTVKGVEIIPHDWDYEDFMVFPKGWTEWNKDGWTIETAGEVDDSDGAEVLLDGEDYDGIYGEGDFSLTVDMKEKKTLAGVGLWYQYWCSPQSIQLSVSSDGETWSYLGQVSSNDENVDFIKFYEPVTTRYVKFEIKDRWESAELYELHFFKTAPAVK